MNFLAHCALGSAHPHHLVGGFLGDFIKGPVPTNLPLRIQAGVRLHRRIDAFSALQPDIKTSVLRLPSALRRVAPVFIDLVADHFLARHFETVHDEPLATFTARTYKTLADHLVHFPPTALRFFHFMCDHDLLSRYVSLDPVERAFTRISERLGQTGIVDTSMAALRADYDQFEQDFLRYYPALREHAQCWLIDERRPAVSVAPQSC